MTTGSGLGLGALAATALLAAGCILVGIEKEGTRETVSTNVDARPRVYVDGNPCGRVPATIALEPGRQYSVAFKSDGMTMAVSLSGITRRGDIRVETLTNLNPVVLDEAEGAWYPLTSSNVNAILSRRP